MVKRNLALVMIVSGLLAVGFSQPVRAVDFGPLTTLQGGVGFTTAIDFGPEDPDPTTLGDGCVYALNGQTGEVHRICFDDAKTVTSDTVVVDLNGTAAVQHALGLAFDPSSNPSGEIRLYIAYSIDGTAAFNGTIARAVSIDGGVSYTIDETFITGLPREKNPPGNNQTNGLSFGPDGCLYIAQGSNANTGYSGDFSESRLAGAIVRACFNDANGNVDPAYDRNCGSGDVVQACGLEVYASGFRNPYDLIWHSNGQLYSSDNDPSLGFGLDCGVESNNYGCPCQEPTVQPIGDELNLIEQGRYYGSPNPYLAIPSGLQCSGGVNATDACTSNADCPGGTCDNLSSFCTDSLCGDIAQCYYFGFGEDPLPGEDPNGIYRQPILQNAGLMDGMTEYRAKFNNLFPGDFCSDWDGDLLITGGPGLLRRFALSADGQTATDEGTTNLNGATGLDVVVGPDGTIYLADLMTGNVTFIRPIEQLDPMAPNFFVEACVSGQLFTDDFNRASLGPNWVVDSPRLEIIANELVENSVQTFSNARMRWLGGTTETSDQFGKLRITDAQTHTWGFLLRSGGALGEHYEIHHVSGSKEWRWEHHDPDFLSRKGECFGDVTISNGDWVGATIEGTGLSTVVNIWRWGTDPDNGGAINIPTNWGAPDCTIQNVAGPYVDDGTTIGLRTYTGSSVASAAMDNWSGGDVAAVSGAVAGIPPCLSDTDCDDANPCTDDTCNPMVGCSNTSNTLSCDDGDVCTGSDTCSSGICVGGAPDHCGDSIVQSQCGEECDDGGQVSGDGCSANCLIEGTPCSTQVTRIIDGSGAGTPGSLIDPDGVTVDAAGNVYIAACGLSTTSEGVFKVTPSGVKTQLADGTGDGTNALTCPVGIDTDSLGNVYTVGFLSDNAFRISPAGVITQIIDTSGDGTNPLLGTLGLVVDAADNVFVTGNASDNVFRITPGGLVTQIIDSSGDGTNVLSAPFGLTVDITGNVFVAGFASNNVFKITPGGVISQVMDASGDGNGNTLNNPHDIAVDSAGNCYVTGNGSDNVFRVSTTGTITEIADVTGDGAGAYLDNPTGIAVDGLANVYVAAWVSENGFRISPGGTITQIIDSTGDGTNTFRRPADFGVAIEPNGNVIMSSTLTDNVFRISISGVSCGDGIVDTCEACDDAGESAICDADCTLAVCGDGLLNLTAGELCEVDSDCLASEVCSGSCACIAAPVCGNSVVETGEQCDDGNVIAGDGCDPTCQFESTGNFVRGGRLYDRWWAEKGIAGPTTDHTLWQYRPDLSSNATTGSGTWRCKECHGWDYKGVSGQYATGVHRTGFAGIIQTTLGAADLTTLLTDPPNNGGGTGVLNGHDYGSVLTATDITDLVAFVQFGTIDGDVYIDPTTALFNGDAVQGEINYTTQGSISCINCHGVNGTGINFGTASSPEYLGQHADENPWEFIHKVRMAQPGTPMPSWLAGGGTNQGAADIGRYVQDTFPTCGNSVVETGEACDDGAQTATCDGNCTLPTCGDGTLNTLAGEACEADMDCAVGEVCRSCACVPAPPGQLFCDDFNRASLGSNWVADNLSFSIIGNQIVEDSGALFAPGQLRWTGGNTDTVDQFGKVQLHSAQGDTVGFMFRVNGTPASHYEVHLPGGTSTWRWERYDPLWVETKATCLGDFAASSGDYVGVTIQGVGASTTVSVWRWSTDPDSGGPVHVGNNWGAPDCTMTAVAPPYVDTGSSIGLRAYAGSSTQYEVGDNWCGGDIAVVTGSTSCAVDADCDDGNACNGLETCDAMNTCQAGTPLACDDGDICNGVETCDTAAGCLAGTSLSCDDGNECTDDTCDSITGCVNTDNAAFCDDSVACTTGDVCSGGVCAGVANCPTGQQCDSGTGLCIVPPTGQLFCDDFNRTTLGANWAVDSANFVIAGNELVEDSGQLFRTGQMRWVAGVTDTADQFGKLQVTNIQSHTWGFLLRQGGAGGAHYEIHLPVGGNTWNWERMNPGFSGRIATCVGDAAVSPGDWLGVTVAGSGNSTVVQVWRWDTDPDTGGTVHITNNWGMPVCTMTGGTGPFVDSGQTVGVRTYTGASSASASVDNWCGGDTAAVTASTSCVVDTDCTDGNACNGFETCDAMGQCQSGMPLACDDGDVCNGVETCDAVAGCLAGVALNCDDANACTNDSCDPTGGCINTNNVDACDDGVACTSGDICSGGVCSGADNCPTGQQCDIGSNSCVVTSLGQLFCDDFNRGSLGPNWVADNLSFAIVGNELVEDSGATFSPAQLRWAGGLTDTVYQFGKIQVRNPQVDTYGFMFRASGTPGQHYEVHLPGGSLDWRWERYNPFWVETKTTCTGDAILSDGDYVGAMIQGTGAATVVSVWRWDVDPDSGGPVDIANNWGTPVCTMSAVSAPYVDTGNSIGVRAYAGSSTANEVADNWCGGDVSGGNGP